MRETSTDWGIHQYRRPSLDIDEVRVDPVRGAVILSKQGEVFEIVSRDKKRARIIVKYANRLRDANWEGWAKVARGSAAAELLSFVQQLDYLGLISENDDGGKRAVKAERAQLGRYREQVVSWLRDLDTLSDTNSLRTVARAVRQEARLQLRVHRSDVVSRTQGTLDSLDRGNVALEGSNFYVRTLCYQLHCWRLRAPLSLTLLVLVLNEFLSESEQGSEPIAAYDDAEEIVEELAGGTYSILDVEAHLTGAAMLLALATTPSSRFRLAPVAVRAKRRSGLNTLLDAERYAADALHTLGESTYQRAIAAGENILRLAQGTYLQQYAVTRRFTEVITPLMGTRLRSPLRESVFQYYAEEDGHEAHELEACKRVGIDERHVKQALPLPLFLAHVEALTHVASVEPVGFILCMMLAEGLPGTRQPVNGYFMTHGLVPEEDETAIRRHAVIDETLDHSTLARRMILTVPSVHPDAAARGLDHLRFMLELNHRAWEMLYDYCAVAEAPVCPEWLCLPPHTVLTWGSSR